MKFYRMSSRPFREIFSYFVALLFWFSNLSLTPISAQTSSASPLSPPSSNATLQDSAPATNAPAPPAAPAITDPFNDPLIKQIQARSEKALKGDTKETKALTADLEKWTREQPANYLLQAYLGSVYTLDSRDAWPGPGKLTFLRNGGKLMDAAVAAAPHNPAVRFVRAIDYFELPSFFGKSATARDDFQILVKEIDGDIKTPYVLDIETQQAIYYYAGLSFKQLAQLPQAKVVWGRGLSLDDASPLGEKIKAELANVK
jgi:hypothetical protein